MQKGIQNIIILFIALNIFSGILFRSSSEILFITLLRHHLLAHSPRILVQTHSLQESSEQDAGEHAPGYVQGDEEDYEEAVNKRLENILKAIEKTMKKTMRRLVNKRLENMLKAMKKIMKRMVKNTTEQQTLPPLTNNSSIKLLLVTEKWAPASI